MNLKITYREMAELRIVLGEKRHNEFCKLSNRSSKSPDKLMEIQNKLYGGDIRLGEDPRTDDFIDTMSPMVLCTSMLNKIQDIEDECQNQLGDN